ncbi:Ubiquitin [Chryseobacterium soldanellicola]|uniref:Ubiquitin n=1 Tax=Chryseobacterium soldanellicola TaxID=311333 RepID=A0A1H1FG99_9FLAO|nr:Ubiquitin [Chryseobacterium soldanellicola]
MLLATQLERVFILKDNEQEIRLNDPEPKWSVESVMNLRQYVPDFDNCKSIFTTNKR